MNMNGSQGIGLSFLLSLLFLTDLAIGQDREEQASKSEFARPILIQVEGEINKRRLLFVEQAIRNAKQNRHDLVVLEIDSPGGGLDESLLIAELMRDLDWAETAAFIPNKALSGGALIALGCDQIFMAEEARIGDAGVIMLDERFMFRYAPEKIVTDLVARARGIAATQGHPEELAEAMIDRSAVVYKNTEPRPGESEFKIEYFDDEAKEGSESVAPEQLDEGKWLRVDESIPNRFLEVNGKRAFELSLATSLAKDRQQLSNRLGFENDVLVVRKYRTSDAFAFYLSRTWAMALLVIVGVVALYFELSAPGISFGGLLSALCFGLFFWSRFLGGTAGWLEVLLFVAGIGFLMAEVFVVPGTGLTGILGGLLLLGSLLMASHKFVIPSNSVELTEMGSTGGVLLLSLGGCVGLAFLAARLGHRLPLLNRFILTPPSAEDIEQVEAAIGKDSGLTHIKCGDWGVTETILRPYGKARFGQQTIDVASDGAFVEQGIAVRVQKIQGKQVTVRAEEAAS